MPYQLRPKFFPTFQGCSLQLTGLRPPGLPTRSAPPGSPPKVALVRVVPARVSPAPSPFRVAPHHQPRHHVAYLCTFSLTPLPDNLVLLARLQGFVVLLYEGITSSLPKYSIILAGCWQCCPRRGCTPGLRLPGLPPPHSLHLIRVIPESCDQHGSGWKNRHGACPGLAMALRVS